MKCDELEEYYYYEDRVVTPSTHLYRVYHADKVDKVIAEKDEEIARLEAIRKVPVEAVDSMVAGLHQDYKEILRLRRALWLARANSADGQFIYWCARFAGESGFTKADIRGYSVNTKRKLRTIGEWIETWKNVESKCRAKAEEFK